MAFGFGLTILGTGVREPMGFRDAVPPVPIASLSPQEQEDLAAFERHGWRFSSDPGATWRRPLPEDPSSVNACVLARRAEKGLVMVQNRLVVALQPEADPKPLLDRYPRWEPLPFGDNLFTVSLATQDGDL